MSSDEKPTPPVPPSDHMRVPELDDEATGGVIEREPQDTECPQCGGTIYYVARKTGEAMMATWDPETFDHDEYRLDETYERTERYQVCDRCGWRVDL